MDAQRMRRDQKVLVAFAALVGISAWIIALEVITGLWRTWIYAVTLAISINITLLLLLLYFYFNPRLFNPYKEMSLRRIDNKITLSMIAFFIEIFVIWFIARTFNMEYIYEGLVGFLLFPLVLVIFLSVIRFDMKKRMMTKITY